MKFLLCLLLCCAAADVSAQPYWSIGPKLGYTFGKDGSFTGGLEITYFPQHLGSPYGVTCDVTFWNNHRSIHVGLESWLYVGADIGPTLFFANNDTHLGMSIVLWDGLMLYPYYELGIPFNGTLYHSVGTYLKYPLDSRGREVSFTQ